MESIRIADINDRYDIEKLVKVMLGDNDPDKIAKLLVDDFYLNNSYMVYVVEVLNLVKGFGVVKFNPFEGGNGIAEIVFLGIDTENKRTGLGCKLVQNIEQVLKNNGIRKIYAKTSVTNLLFVSG